MASLTDAAFRRAEVRGRKLLESEPRAASAQYDRRTGRVALDLIDGCTYLFPLHLVEDLQDAAPRDLSVIEVEGHGLNLSWPRLGVDLYVPALLAGVFGTRNWMAKTTAVRATGAKGRRPGKQA